MPSANPSTPTAKITTKPLEHAPAATQASDYSKIPASQASEEPTPSIPIATNSKEISA